MRRTQIDRALERIRSTVPRTWARCCRCNCDVAGELMFYVRRAESLPGGLHSDNYYVCTDCCPTPAELVSMYPRWFHLPEGS